MRRTNIKKNRPPVNPWVFGLCMLLLGMSIHRVESWIYPQTSPTMAQMPANEVEKADPLPLTAVDAAVLPEGGENLFAAAFRGREESPRKQQLPDRQEEKGPQILIYHTHTTEAYTQTADSPYKQTSAFRTNDADKSVLAVGEALKEVLEKEYGYIVLHDTTDHEPPKLSTAYTRSEKTMAAYRAKYPSLEVFIDLHRDAGSNEKDYVAAPGGPAARVMCVVGKGEKYEQKPDFDSNYSLASRFTETLNQLVPGMGRPVRVKPGRYNQHISSHCLLLEVGHNANTLEQALNAVPLIARALAAALGEGKAETFPVQAALYAGEKNAAAGWLVPRD